MVAVPPSVCFGVAMPKPPRIRAVAACALLAVVAACTQTGGPREGDPTLATATGPSISPGAVDTMEDLIQAACSLPRPWLVRMQRGYRADRGADIQLVGHQPHFIARPGEFPHSGVWPYLSDVPMLLYGPGYIRPTGKIARPASVADITPTLASLVDLPDGDFEGRVMREALVAPWKRRQPPRVMVVIVWDAGGRVVIDTWPNAHPVLDRMIREGAWYENATVGSAPTSTAQIHATIGAGVFPRTHGIVSQHLRIDGELVGPWQEGPAYMDAPTFADLYDPHFDNRGIVALSGTSPWHLGMIGHGSGFEGGDADIAVLHKGGTRGQPDDPDEHWGLFPADRPFFRFPQYANDLPRISKYFPQVDALDGVRDGTWRGENPAKLNRGFDTPARLPFQTRLVKAIMQREGFGQDRVPDLLLLNYKVIDEVGHRFNLNSLQMRDAVKLQDRQLTIMETFLNRNVGRGKWVLMVTADHGHTPDTKVSGALRISANKLEEMVEAEFGEPGGEPVVQLIQPAQMFVFADPLQQGGHTLADVSRFLAGVTIGEAFSPDTPPSPSQRDDPVFQAAFPSSLLTQELDCSGGGSG